MLRYDAQERTAFKGLFDPTASQFAEELIFKEVVYMIEPQDHFNGCSHWST